LDEYRRTGNDDSSFAAFEAYKKATLVQKYKDSYLEDRKRQFDALFLEK
jgi:hypothetical protein